jgi:antitoxin (DNA-binding transcriptional repressor) of toxin-antitoxin stability system
MTEQISVRDVTTRVSKLLARVERGIEQEQEQEQEQAQAQA